jgi:hypothetical protein
MLLHILADPSRARFNSLGTGVHLHVVQAVHVGALDLSNSGAGNAVAASGFSALQVGIGTMHPHEDDIDIGHHGHQIFQPPRLTEHVVHDNVVARQRHSCDCTVKPGAGTAQYFTQTGSIEIVSLPFGTYCPIMSTPM